MATWNHGGLRVIAAGVALGLTVWIAPPRTSAQAAQASATAQSVQYSSGGATIDAYIARPTGAPKSPAVIVVHDDLGANKAFRELTQQFAQAGFVALAPHLPSRSRTPAADPSDGRPPQRTPVTGLNTNQTVEDVKTAFGFLQQDPSVDAARISAVGVGWGEYRVWKLAEQTPTLHRAVVFYGITPTDDDRLRAIRTAVLGHYAEQDYLVTMRVLKTKKLLDQRFTYHIYPTTPGFLGGGTGQLQLSTGGYVTSIRGSTPEAAAAAAKLAWTRTLDFLKGTATTTPARR
jgi:carboxymethylenebutenolidase